MSTENSSADFDAALLELDEKAVRSFFERWGLLDPGFEPIEFWRMVHSLRANHETLPLEARMVSRRWLVDQGFESTGAAAPGAPRRSWASLSAERSLGSFLASLGRVRRS